MAPSLLKRAAVHGINYALIRSGAARYPSKLAADGAADHVADEGAGSKLPEPSPEGPPEATHSPQDIMAVAQQLMQAAEQLMAEAHAGGGAPGAAGGAMPGMPPPEAAEASAADLGKAAAASDLETVAHHEAIEMMQKISVENKVEISKPGNKNTAQEAAKHEGLAALDLKQRPLEEYHHGAGKTEFDTMQGEIGKIKTQPALPKNTPSGSNSVTADIHKSAAFADFKAAVLKQAAVGEKVEISKEKNKNTDAAAAQSEGLAALDLKQRPANYALTGVGGAVFSEPAAARVGMETPHPEKPKTSPSGTNAVIQASKSAAELEQEQLEAAYVLMFDKTAAVVGPHLPANMEQAHKVASINAMMGLSSIGRNTLLGKIQACKTAGELSELLGMTHGTEEVKKDAVKAEGEKKEEKKDEKKEASLSILDRVGEIAARATAPKK